MNEKRCFLTQRADNRSECRPHVWCPPI